MNSLFLIGILCFASMIEHSTGEGNSFENFMNFMQAFLRTTYNELAKFFSSPHQFFIEGPKVLLNYKGKLISEGLSILCSLYMSAETEKPQVVPNVTQMGLHLMTRCKTLQFPLEKIEDIFKVPEFNVAKKMAIFITGFNSHPQKYYVIDMATAFNCRGDYNFLVLNADRALITLYPWAVYNTEEIGRHLAVALAKMVKQVPLKKIHLIGHSLGAHIAGSASRYFTNYTGLNIARITALDPANPCFQDGESLYGLQRGDADFIDVIHSNNGVLGKRAPTGDVDFYPGGLSAFQRGCEMVPCSHVRAILYFTETVYPGNEENFLAVRCTSLIGVNRGLCRGTKVPMGLTTPTNLKGNYFLSVNEHKPFGQNANRNVTDIHCWNHRSLKTKQEIIIN